MDGLRKRLIGLEESIRSTTIAIITKQDGLKKRLIGLETSILKIMIIIITKQDGLRKRPIGLEKGIPKGTADKRLLKKGEVLLQKGGVKVEITDRGNHSVISKILQRNLE